MKDILLGLLIGGILGLWGGVNLGKQQSLFSNPFKAIDAVVTSIETPLPKAYVPPESGN